MHYPIYIYHIYAFESLIVYFLGRYTHQVPKNDDYMSKSKERV
jgi:hypothetical protein